MTTSSTWIIACRSAKRWFDLDAVRQPHAAHTLKYDMTSGNVRGVGNKKNNPDRMDGGLREYPVDPAGAPPLDWHSDLPEPAGPIRLADEWQTPPRSHLEQLDGLPRKIVLSMCPWAVCTVCGVARERVVKPTEWVRRPHPMEAFGVNAGGLGVHGDRRAQPETLAWSDCGHDSFRPGIVYDPAAGVLLYRTSEDDMTLRYIVGDTRDVTATIPDGSVDLIFTSPPFLALRSYLPADHPDKHREIGSEANPAAFLDVLLELTAEWGRVLAPHGTLAVELGDTYSGSGGESHLHDSANPEFGRPKQHAAIGTPAKRSGSWPLAKSLACIPQLYMIALAYGLNPLTGEPSPAGRWRVRNWIAWHRPNPPVGALGDKWRPASSYITVACKGAKRWFDLDAVRTEAQVPSVRVPEPKALEAERLGHHGKGMPATGDYHANGGAPPLDWHTDGDLGVGHIILSTQPYPGSHYATFPVDLPRKIIDCMCPRQVCTVCGVARERIVGDAEYVETKTGRVSPLREFDQERVADGVRAFDMTGKGDNNLTRIAPTLGWSDCGHDSWRPGIVYDPFAGSGTTLEAAQDLGRDGIGADLDERNSWLARERLGMFAEFDTLEPSTVDIVSDLL